jgi:transcriptional regulator with XRE-family HTH domain
MDRAYAMNLAMIRKAAQLTQVEVAKRLGVGQAAVSRMESRGDMLLSTLYD